MPRIFTLLCLLTLFACEQPTKNPPPVADEPRNGYFDNTGRDDVYTGGVKMIPIETPSGTFNVYTKRTGNNPKIKVLLLHGGPGVSSLYFEPADSYFPGAAIEYYYYDQLGSYRSDHPGDTSLWNTPRFVEEVEQVRQALDLGPDNFYVLGHSWGGILGIEYALKYQDKMKGLIISNMMSSCPAYGRYAHEVLGPGLGEETYRKILAYEDAEDFSNPDYVNLMTTEHYTKHVLRRPLGEWPRAVNVAFENTNPDIYVPMQGPSEFGIRGKLANWDRTEDLAKIEIPTLVIGAQHDTMDPAFMKMMSEKLPKGEYLHCPDGSHMAMWDDQEVYFMGIIDWLKRQK
ncbi:proline iminopeptidase [Lewinellaceae bacterium SD302]|nr:proline iminopeptidase [Lewinellaceae bacterium SD302]